MSSTQRPSPARADVRLCDVAAATQGDLSRHALKDMLENKMSVSLGTDNRLMSRTTICREYRLAADFFNLVSRSVRNRVR